MGYPVVPQAVPLWAISGFRCGVADRSPMVRQWVPQWDPLWAPYRFPYAARYRFPDAATYGPPLGSLWFPMGSLKVSPVGPTMDLLLCLRVLLRASQWVPHGLRSGLPD